MGALLVKSLLRLRQSLGVVTVIVLAACAGAQSVSPNAGAGSSTGIQPTRVTFNHGGRFSAAYAGSYSFSGDCSITRMFTYSGSGNAKFLHSSREQINFTWYCGSQNFTGSATLTSIRDPGNSVTASVSSTDFRGPCYGFTMSFTVTGGTGKFRRASGSGTVVMHGFTGDCASYSYSDKWKGTLKFRR